MTASHRNNPRPDEDTDLGTLWQEALIKYHEECGTDLRALPLSRLNLAHIKAEQDRQLLIFSEYRHDKGKLDKLRSLITTNSDIVVGVATHIANAASSAFPPSAAILTAFNYVMNASRAVSEDYDMIISFFDIMNSFLERVSMLESRMPGEWQFRRFLVNVFSAMLTLSAIARKCRMKGRLSKWAKALIDGSDPKLKGAFDALHMHLERFESVAMLTTLKYTLESGKKLDSLGQDVKRIHDGVEKNIMLTQDAASTSHEILTVVTRQDERGAEYTAGLHQVMKTLNKMSKPKDAPGQLVDAGSRKSIAMRMLEELLDYYPEEKDSLADFESYYVNGTCDWFRAQDKYIRFEAGDVRLLWVSGPAGMGKSTLAYSVVKALQDEFIVDTTTSVAHFFFQEDGGRRNVSQMLQSCALQIAARDSSYREQAVAAVQVHNKLRGYAESVRELRESNDKIWELLFRTKFSKKAGSRLILVIDGVDGVDKEDYRYIEMIFEEVSASEDMNIQVLFTSESRGFTPESKASKAQVFELTKELILPDIQTIVMERLKRVERLRKLSQGTRRRIVAKLPKKADTIRYADYMLRRLAQLGRERAVLRELDNLPESTDEMYEILLNDCQKGRTDQEIIVLRQLFAWLAYTQEGLRIGCANKLLHYISENSTIDIDEELEQGCSRILGLTRVYRLNRGQDDGDTGTENLDDGKLDEDEDDDDNTEDYLIVVGFQGKGLRSYFRHVADAAGDKLRMTESSGHVTVLRIIESILCTESDTSDDIGERILGSYASTSWHRHFRAINREELSQEETASVIESTCRILSNRGGSIEKTERLYDDCDGPGLPCVLGDTEEIIEATLSCLREWALSAAQIPPSLVSDATLGWAQQVAQNPREVFIQVAESHVRNWLASYGLVHEAEINKPFLFAHYALYQAQNLPAVQQKGALRSHLSRCGNDGEFPSSMGSEPFVVVSRAFSHIDMTAQGHLSVAMSIYQTGWCEPSLRQLQMAIRLAATDLELMEVYTKMAEILMRIALLVKDGIPLEDWEPVETDEAGPEGTDGPGSETSGSVDGVDEEPHVQGYDEWVSQALHAATKATDIALKLPEAAMNNPRVRVAVRPAWIYRAMAEIMSGDATNTITYCRRAVQSCKMNEVDWDMDLITPLAESKHWTTLLGVIEVFKTKFGNGLAMFLEHHTDAIFAAAKATGEVEYVLEQYRETILAMNKMNSADSGLLIGWARFYRDVVATAEGTSKAKALLDKVIDTRGSSAHVTEASFYLSDILLEEFRRAPRGEEKRAAYDKMRDLVRRVGESMGAEFDPTQSQTVIPLAHMARKMDAVEFQGGLERTFQGCVAALTDETGWNDWLSMRVLARVLALVGLEREAQIAASGQMYVLDVDIYKRENDFSAFEQSDGGNDLEGSEIGGTGDTAAQDGATSNSPVDPDSSDPGDDEERDRDEEEGSTVGEPSTYGDITWAREDFCCSGCKTQVLGWSRRRPMYLCYYCTELDLCQKCFDKRAQRIAGEPSDDWRLLCPEGHRHIKTPMEGWAGIEDGVLRLDGKEVRFREWLDEVKEKKWPEAWVKFWSEDR